MKIVKWGILGAGFIANAFAESFPASENCQLRAVTDRTLEKAQSLADKNHVPVVYGSSDELAADPEVDVVYIATPTYQHCSLIKQMLNAGKHVLCEKTITMSGAQLDECMAIAKKNGLILAEGLTSIYEPVMGYMKKKIDAGEYGKLHFVTVTCGSLKPYDASNRYFSPSLGGGAIFDIGCYAIGFANYFMSSYPDQVQSIALMAGTGVDQKSAYILRNKEDEFATVMINLRSKTEKIGIIACEEAFIRIEQFIRAHKAEVVFPDGRKETYEFPVMQLEEEVRDLTKDIQEGKADCSVCPIELSRSVLKVMDDARAQWGYKFDFEK